MRKKRAEEQEAAEEQGKRDEVEGRGGEMWSTRMPLAALTGFKGDHEPVSARSF